MHSTREGSSWITTWYAFLLDGVHRAEDIAADPKLQAAPNLNTPSQRKETTNMTTNPQRERNTLFPPGSVGRSSTQASLSRTSSHESLTAHPLLSPTLAVATSPASSDPTAAPRYVPYTPRQRVATTSTTTTGTTALSSPPPHSFQGDATSKLQLMNLKAAAQKGGLDAASTGWAILEKLGTEGDHGPEWNRIWAALAVGKVRLRFVVPPPP